jgi:hypothetical protein
MKKDYLLASIEGMSLPELTALEAKTIQVAASAVASEEPNAISDEPEKRMRALKREMSSR